MMGIVQKGHFRELTISAVLNGFVVRVGCQTAVFTDAKTMADWIQKYGSNPAEVEQEFVRKHALPFHPNPGTQGEVVNPSPIPVDPTPQSAQTLGGGAYPIQQFTPAVQAQDDEFGNATLHQLETLSNQLEHQIDALRQQRRTLARAIDRHYRQIQPTPNVGGCPPGTLG